MDERHHREHTKRSCSLVLILWSRSFARTLRAGSDNPGQPARTAPRTQVASQTLNTWPCHGSHSRDLDPGWRTAEGSCCDEGFGDLVGDWWRGDIPPVQYSSSLVNGYLMDASVPRRLALTYCSLGGSPVSLLSRISFAGRATSSDGRIGRRIRRVKRASARRRESRENTATVTAINTGVVVMRLVRTRPVARVTGTPPSLSVVYAGR